jgi:hypothetical protein
VLQPNNPLFGQSASSLDVSEFLVNMLHEVDPGQAGRWVSLPELDGELVTYDLEADRRYEQ